MIITTQYYSLSIPNPQRMGHLFRIEKKFHFTLMTILGDSRNLSMFECIFLCFCFFFARSAAQPASSRVLDMTEALQWARYHWQRLIGSTNTDDDERPYNYSSLLGCGGKSSQTPKVAGRHRVVVPHLRPFKDEYEKFSGTYVNNRIRTTKYTLLNFVPRNLFEQFHRYCYLFKTKS